MMDARISRAGGGVICLHGQWTLAAIGTHAQELRRQLQALAPGGQWDLRDVARLDSFGALLLWQHWGRRWPQQCQVSDVQRATLEAVAQHARGDAIPAPRRAHVLDPVVHLGEATLGAGEHARDLVVLIGQLALNLLHLLRTPAEWPLKEISANVFKAGVRAMPVSALVGFLIGVVLSYLSALQLQMFGADAFIVNILGLGIIRELGPVLIAVLVAGRSGSAMTAQLGVMRVTEEIDALTAMGISPTLRLVLPKVVALALVMPLLVVWTCAVALLGGMVAAWVQMDFSMVFFLQSLPDAVPGANVWIALAKGVAFGTLIALIACHFGLRVKPNTESLAANTTASVVTSISMVILVDAIFAITTRSIGLP